MKLKMTDGKEIQYILNCWFFYTTVVIKLKQLIENYKHFRVHYLAKTEDLEM